MGQWPWESPMGGGRSPADRLGWTRGCVQKCPGGGQATAVFLTPWPNAHMPTETEMGEAGLCPQQWSSTPAGPLPWFL